MCSNIGRDKYEELRQRLSQLAESDAEVVDEGDLRGEWRSSNGAVRVWRAAAPFPAFLTHALPFVAELLDDPVTVEQVPRVFRILSLS